MHILHGTEQLWLCAFTVCPLLNHLAVSLHKNSSETKTLTPKPNHKHGNKGNIYNQSANLPSVNQSIGTFCSHPQQHVWYGTGEFPIEPTCADPMISVTAPTFSGLPAMRNKQHTSLFRRTGNPGFHTRFLKSLLHTGGH